MMKVLFRADGNTLIGLGHVIRSLALAEMLKSSFHCAFAIQRPTELLYKTISSVCSEVIVLPDAYAGEERQYELDPYLSGSDIVVLDGYKFDTEYQAHIKSKDCGLVCIDDVHSYHFVADVIINHGITNTSVYSKEAYTKMLVGPAYSLLRKPFLNQIASGFPVKQENAVFLCFGGADALNLTCTYVRRLLQQENLSEIYVVVGSAFQHHNELDHLAKMSRKRVHIHHNVGPEELVSIIRKCKVAIVPGSTVAIECASVGIPMMCGYYVDNQHDIVGMLEETKLAFSIGDFTALSDQLFLNTLQQLCHSDAREWYNRSRIFFDGKSEDRFIKAFERLFSMQKIHLRRAAHSDVSLFYTWANDPEVRRNAVHTQKIHFKNHCEWYTGKLASKESFIYVAAIGDDEFGQVRFDREEDVFNIDYSIKSDMRGKGLAQPMLAIAMQKLQKDAPIFLPLKAMVKSSNLASKKVFESLAFISKETKIIDSEEYHVFEKRIGRELINEF